MKRYKLNVIDNNHRIGFIFPSMELLNNRMIRMKEKVHNLNRTLRIVETDSDTELEMCVFVE